MSGEEYITAAAAGNENHKGPIAAGGTEQRQRRGNIPPAAAATGLFLKLPRCVCPREEKRTVAAARRAASECEQTKDVATDGRTSKVGGTKKMSRDAEQYGIAGIHPKGVQCFSLAQTLRVFSPSPVLVYGK